jgi:uncharacterized LabA/DUF88 family protein
MATERVAIFVDGGNFHHLAIKKLSIDESKFDFDAYAQNLVNGRTLVSKAYCTGTVRAVPGDQRALAALAKQTTFLTKLAKGKWGVETSKLQRRDEVLPIDDRVNGYKRLRLLGLKSIKYTRDREKGIDVKIAVDILMGAANNTYDCAIIVSSDRDLLPAITCARRQFGKRVEYIGFSIPDPRNPKDPQKASNPTIALMKNSDIQRVMAQTDLNPFVIP